MSKAVQIAYKSAQIIQKNALISPKSRKNNHKDAQIRVKTAQITTKLPKIALKTRGEYFDSVCYYNHGQKCLIIAILLITSPAKCLK